MATMITVNEVLANVAKAFDVKFDSARAAIYYTRLQDVTDAQLKAAGDRAIDEGERFPTVKALRAYAGKQHRDRDDATDVPWGEVWLSDIFGEKSIGLHLPAHQWRQCPLCGNQCAIGTAHDDHCPVPPVLPIPEQKRRWGEVVTRLRELQAGTRMPNVICEDDPFSEDI
jgi:hypothetical protein